ncbi:MAG: amidohydrolase [Ruminococcaceae bacterium]|nr:amidohydrolase [Oscillospiraceae bacterium]
MRTGIVDFHAHPFLHPENNTCHYRDGYAMNPDSARERLSGLGISTVCGSMLGPVKGWADIVRLNDRALDLRERWGEFYMPGFHIHPDYIEQSVKEVERMAAQGVKLLGEVVPYMHGWDFTHPGLVPVLEAAQEAGMVFSFHSTNIADEVLEPLLTRFPDLAFVAAHPGEKKALQTHLGRMERHKNYFLDLSGTGIGRMGMLRYAMDRAGKERFLFGTDFPICPPEMYVAAVDRDPMLTEEEKQAVFCDNAKRILFGA